MYYTVSFDVFCSLPIKRFAVGIGFPHCTRGIMPKSAALPQSEACSNEYMLYGLLFGKELGRSLRL